LLTPPHPTSPLPFTPARPRARDICQIRAPGEGCIKEAPRVVVSLFGDIQNQRQDQVLSASGETRNTSCRW